MLFYLLLLSEKMLSPPTTSICWRYVSSLQATQGNDPTRHIRFPTLALIVIIITIFLLLLYIVIIYYIIYPG